MVARRKSSLSSRALERRQQEKAAEVFDNGELVEAWMPILRKLGKPGEVTAQQMVDRLGPLGVMVLAQLMVGAESERVRFSSAREMAYMHGMKPVERSQNVNVNLMAEAELDALLRSTLDDIGLNLIEPRDRAAKSGAEAEVVVSSAGEEASSGGEED